MLTPTPAPSPYFPETFVGHWRDLNENEEFDYEEIIELGKRFVEGKPLFFFMRSVAHPKLSIPDNAIIFINLFIKNIISI